MVLEQNKMNKVGVDLSKKVELELQYQQPTLQYLLTRVLECPW